MYIKYKYKFILLGLLSLIAVFLVFCPIQTAFVDNHIVFSSLSHLKFEDGGVFTAITVGMFTVLISSYYNIKNYKSMKLVSIPENSANLLMDVEYIFMEYGLDNENYFSSFIRVLKHFLNKYVINKRDYEKDVFQLLINILTLWKEHHKVFRLLTPHFYKEFYKIWLNTTVKIDKNDDIYLKNSKYFLNAMLIQFSDVAIINGNGKFSFIKPELITDKNVITDEILENNLDEYSISRNVFLKYIENIKGEQTKKQTKKEFDRFYNRIYDLFIELRWEIDEYD